MSEPHKVTFGRPSRGVMLRMMPNAFNTVPLGVLSLEKVYVTPQFLSGISSSSLRAATQNIQIQTARFWFFSNYVPLNPKDWMGFGPHRGGFGRPFAPQSWTPDEIIDAEFTASIGDEARKRVCDGLRTRSQRWILISGAEQSNARPDAGDAQKTREELEEILPRLDAVATEVCERHVGLGHNQGPQLLNEAQLEQIREAVRETLNALPQGSSGKPDAEHALDRLLKARNFVANALLTGLIAAPEQDAYENLKPKAFALFHYLSHVILLLTHWMTIVF